MVHRICFFLSLLLDHRYVQVLGVEFSDVTYEAFVNNPHLGLISAFGDFNSDKLTDLFCIVSDKNILEVVFANDTQPHFGRTTLKCPFDHAITGVIPSDFNGDSMMDVLITIYDENNDLFEVTLLWGSLNELECSKDVAFKMTSQPFIIDYNDDIIPDIIGEDENQNRCVWLSQKSKIFIKETMNTTYVDKLQKMKIPHSSSILDVNNDMVSDLVITGAKSIEFWLRTTIVVNHFNLSYTIPYPSNFKVWGQLTFVDLNTNGKLDYIIPVCEDFECKHSAIMIWDSSNSSWIVLYHNFTSENTVWGFLNKNETVLEKAALPITLRAGDFNLDGYPDFILVLENKDRTKQNRRSKAVIFENVPCGDCLLGRSLKIHWNVPGLEKIQDLRIATFYDIFEDGTMDILACSNIKGKWQIHALKNVGSYDAYFIKVLILNGQCYSNCPSNHIPYGTNTPGPMLMFNTTRMTGNPLVSCAVQMYQSAYFPLHLPYSVFGLGQTPNFVDHLTIAIPQMLGNKVHKREWTQIIPNSQMVVIPYPPNLERKWINKLFLTPSRLMLLTFAALVGTCMFIALIIGIFHWKERREDRKEKMQDAHRFHFDAM